MALAVVNAQIGETDFLDSHDMIWEKPAMRWLDGIPLANGDIGAMVWGDGGPLRFTLDKYDAWETREHILTDEDMTYAKLRQLVEQGKEKEVEQALMTYRFYRDYSEPDPISGPYPTRLPMPRLEIDFGRPLDWQQARLHLKTGTATIEGRLDSQEVRAILLTHAHQNLLSIQLEGVPAAQVKVRLRFDHLTASARKKLKKWDYQDPVITGDQTAGTLKLTTPTGYAYAVAWRRVIAGKSGQQNILLAIASTNESSNPLATARDIVDNAAEQGSTSRSTGNGGKTSGLVHT